MTQSNRLVRLVGLCLPVFLTACGGLSLSIPPTPVPTPLPVPPPPAPAPGQLLLPAQQPTPGVSIPPSWTEAKQSAGDLELELYVPRVTYTVGERPPAIAVVRNRSARQIEYQMPCNVYVDLAVRDDSGRVVFDWFRAQFGEIPPCPREVHQFAPGEAISLPLEFLVPVQGRLTLVLSPMDTRQAPVVEIPITASNP